MAGKFWIAAGALLAAIGVALGAVGTHVLKETLHAEESVLQTYDVAVRYQLYHAMALVLTGVLSERHASRWTTAAGIALLAGILLFSGGIYLWLATGIQPFVHIVPFGGLAWIVAWLLLAAGALANKRATS
jgi:uncharacterized membrane protein YgdD (TMEM256/DUF423 family)